MKYKSCCGRLAAGAGTAPTAAATDSGAGELPALAELFAKGRYAELERQAQGAVEVFPTAAVIWQLLGIAQVRQGKDARQALETAVRYAPADPVAQLNLGNELARQGRSTEAGERYVLALALQPDFPEAHKNLGDLHLDSGRALEAAACFTRAVSQHPHYAEGHHALGAALLKLARWEEAAASCRRALALEPDYAEAYNSLGSALLRLAQREAALASFQRALELNPGFVEAHANLANALRAVGRLDDAVAGYAQALALRPDFVPAHVDLATARRLQRRGADAEASCRAALTLDPRSSPALVVLAELRADVGRFAEALELFAQAVKIDPDCVDAWAGVTRVRRMTVADGAWLSCVENLADSGLAASREMVLRFALGKYFDDLADAERAFAQYRRANELSRLCGPRHDRRPLVAAVDRLIERHDAPWLRGARSTTNSSSRPVLIVGMPRSGTTLTEQILAAHPDVFGAGELTFWSDALPQEIADRGQSAERVARDHARLEKLGSQYLELLTGLSVDASRVIDKMPSNFLCLGLIHAALPGARVIHVRRHPIDTCLSIYFQHLEAANTYANELGEIAHYYREYRRLMRHWTAVLPAGTVLDVPYEGLVQSPGEWTRRMLEFIDVSWDSKCLEFHESTHSVVTASKWQVRQKIHRGAVQRWRRYEKYLMELLPLLPFADD